MSCLFYLFKFVYVTLTLLVLLYHNYYTYLFLQRFDFETIFQNNHFAHFMGMFLGFLFRFSGMLSAIKEKISLTFTYTLFLLLILLLQNQFDYVFLLHSLTLMCSIIYAIVLKYRRAKQKRSNVGRISVNPANPRSRTSEPSSTAAATAVAAPSQVAIALMHDTVHSSIANASPTAPPYELDANTIPRGDRPTSDLYFNPLHNTPPPSYSELYETK